MKRRGRFLLLFISALMIMMLSAVGVNAATAIKKSGATDKETALSKAVGTPVIRTVYNAKTGIAIVVKPQTGVKEYKFYRYSVKDGVTRLIGTAAPSADNTFIDTVTKNLYGQAYVYTVRAVDNSGNNSALSNKPRIVRVMPAKFTSKKPKTYNTIELKWELVGTSKAISGYQIEYAKTANDLSKRFGSYKKVNVGPGKSSYTLTGLTGNTKYYLRMRSFYRYSVNSQLRISYSCFTSIFTVTTPVKPPTYHALCIGNGNYKTGGRLFGPPNDAQAVASTLGKYNYKTTKKVDLTNSQILSSIDSALGGVASTDVSMFFYSGHGGFNGAQGYLVGVDGSKLYFSTLATVLNKIPGKIVVVLDCCYSGNSIAKGGFDPVKFNQAAIDAFARVNSQSKDGELRKSKFLVLTAGTKDELTNDISDGTRYGGKFARAFVAGAGCSFPYGNFSGKIPCDYNGDKKITLTEMYHYTRKVCLVDDIAGADDDIQHVERFPAGSTEIIMKK